MSATCEGELAVGPDGAARVRSGALNGVRLPVRLRRGLLGGLALGWRSFMGLSARHYPRVRYCPQ